MADNDTNGAGPSARTQPEARTTLNFTAGQMAPLATRKKLREQRAKENYDASIGFNHAEFLQSVREDEASGARGGLKALEVAGTLPGAKTAPAAADDASWGAGTPPAGQGGAASGEGVSAEPQVQQPAPDATTAPKQRGRARANA